MELDDKTEAAPRVGSEDDFGEGVDWSHPDSASFELQCFAFIGQAKLWIDQSSLLTSKGAMPPGSDGRQEALLHNQ